MPSTKSAHETREEYIQAMGEELGSYYFELCQEFSRLTMKWNEFLPLFEPNSDTVELVNGTTRLFFNIVYESLWESVLLHITRLTDPPKQREFLNLTIKGLPSRIEDSDLKDKIKTLVKAAKEKTEFSRTWRDKNIAHKDLAFVMGNNAAPLPPAMRIEIEEALSAIDNTLNEISGHYFDAEIAFNPVVPPEGTSLLFHYLKLGRQVALEEERRYKRTQD